MSCWRCSYLQVEFVSYKRMFEGLEMGAGLRVFTDVKVGNIGLKWRVDLRHDWVPHPGNTHPLPQFTLLQDGSTDCSLSCYQVHVWKLSDSMGATKMRLCASYSCETVRTVRWTTDLFHSNFDLLKLCLPTEYRPRDVQPDNPHAICPLHINIHTSPQKNMRLLKNNLLHSILWQQ